MDNKRNLAFSKTNFIMIAVGMAVVVNGFLLINIGNQFDLHFPPHIGFTFVQTNSRFFL